MGIYVIRVPDIGEGIAEVELVAWHVQPGDVVEIDLEGVGILRNPVVKERL